jgi:hypothetical protein
MHSVIKRAISKGPFKKLFPGAGMGRWVGLFADQIAMPKLLAKATAGHKQTESFGNLTGPGGDLGRFKSVGFNQGTRREGSNNVTLATGFQKQAAKPVQTQELSGAAPALPQSQDALSRRNLSLLQRKSLDSTEYEDPKDDLVSFERKSKPTDYEFEALAGARSINITMGSGTRDSSWDRSSLSSRLKMNKIARELGKTIKKDGMANVPGVTIHSGWRSTARQRAAMLKMTSVDVYNKVSEGPHKGQNYRHAIEGSAALTPEQIKSRPIGPKSSKEDKRLRTSAVDHILKRLESKHQGSEGNAFDFSYPGMPGVWKNKGVETKKATDLRARLKKITPNANVVLEPIPKAHVHMAFDKPKKKSILSKVKHKRKSTPPKRNK